MDVVFLKLLMSLPERLEIALVGFNEKSVLLNNSLSYDFEEKTFYITRPNDGSVIFWFHRIILLLVSQATLKVSNNKKM